MGKSFDTAGFKKLLSQLEKTKGEVEAFKEDCANELAQGLITKVKRRTPVGDYTQEVKIVAKRDSKKHKKGDVYTKRINPGGKVGGTLRKSWTLAPISKTGCITSIEVINPVEYASYVEYGHVQTPGRFVPAIGKKLKKGFVQGKFMLKKSVEEVEAAAPKIIQKKMDKWLGGNFK